LQCIRAKTEKSLEHQEPGYQRKEDLNKKKRRCGNNPSRRNSSSEVRVEQNAARSKVVLYS
jgi:hypothetical protein